MNAELLWELYNASSAEDRFRTLACNWPHVRDFTDAGPSQETLRFLALPDIGWRLAKRFAMNRRTCTLLDRPEYRWIKVASGMLVSQGRVRCGGLAAVVSLAQELADQPTGRMIRAALLSENASIRSVAEGLGLDNELVECFECLFFRVLCHQGDSLLRERSMQWAMAFESRNLSFGEPLSEVETLFRISLTADLETVLAVSRRGLFGTHLLPSESDADDKLQNATRLWRQAYLQTGRRMPALLKSASENSSRPEKGKDARPLGKQGPLGAMCRQRLLADAAKIQEDTAKMAMIRMQEAQAAAASAREANHP